ncbi:MAG: NAD-dependent epimerase/dehydratase family protein [Acidobacteriaceae bacterium]|nr:NAD-dependent epimerase/dehydratase family protein [Acidobacteriaceae bacterium]
MRLLIIGASGFIGPHVVADLLRRGHQVATLDRGTSLTQLPQQITTIRGDRNNLEASKEQIEKFGPDIVIDMILSRRRQAADLMDTVRGIARRVVAISSGDVYRACGILHRFEDGPLQEVPLTEESELRTKHDVYPPAAIQQLKNIFGWLDDEYDKIPVEQTVLADSELPGTVLRLPMVYGPGDRLHRFWPYLKRMDDQRPAILLQQDLARWRSPRGYAENVAAAIALAAVDERAAGRIYNVAEPESFSEQEWVRKIADYADWRGTIVTLQGDDMPAHLRVNSRCEQDWSVSSERIRRELGYEEPVPENVAFERTITWERENPPAMQQEMFDYEAEDRALAVVKSG